MTHTERLNKMSVKALKKEIVAHNRLLRGYSRLRKADIIALIIKNKHLFKHLFPSTTSSKSTSTSASTPSVSLPPPTPATAKKALKKKIQKKKAPVTIKPGPVKKARTRVYRFRVNGKEFKKKNDTWARIIEVEGSFPIKQQPALWTAEANVMFGKLKRTGQLKFQHNIKASFVKATAVPKSPGIMMLQEDVPVVPSPANLMML